MYLQILTSGTEASASCMFQMRSLIVDEGGNSQRSEEHTSELQSHSDLVCRLLLAKKKAKMLYCSEAAPGLTSGKTRTRYSVRPWHRRAPNVSTPPADTSPAPRPTYPPPSPPGAPS